MVFTKNIHLLFTWKGFVVTFNNREFLFEVLPYHTPTETETIPITYTTCNNVNLTDLFLCANGNKIKRMNLRELLSGTV